MFEVSNFVAAGKFFLVIAGELVLIFAAVSFFVGILTEYLPSSCIRDFLSNRMMWVQYLLGAGIGAFIYGFFPQYLAVKTAGPGNPWSIPIVAGSLVEWLVY